MGELSTLKGLGPKSESHLNAIGIFTKIELEKLGAVKTFLKLKKECATKPSLNFLYALVGALEDKHWADIAKTEKSRLIMELDGYIELDEILKAEGIAIEL